MIKSIVFDFDGVIADTYEFHYETYDKKYKNMTRELHKKLFEGNIIEGKSKLKFKDKDFDNLKYYEDNLSKLQMSEEEKETLENLSHKYKLFIISSHREYIQKNFLKKEGVLNLFEKIYGYETHKSKIFKFNLLFKEYNLNNNEVIFITDTLGDILEANSVNVKTLAVDFGFHEKSRLMKGNPLGIISKISEVENYT